MIINVISNDNYYTEFQILNDNILYHVIIRLYFINTSYFNFSFCDNNNSIYTAKITIYNNDLRPKYVSFEHESFKELYNLVVEYILNENTT